MKQQLSEAEIRQAMEQLLLATDLMHRHDIVHRDIKPENVLIIEKRELKVCIADLGLACRTTDDKALKVKCGTPGYVDPEVLIKGGVFSTKSDIFSLGCLLYNLVTGASVFQANNPQQVIIKNIYKDPAGDVDECQ